MMLQRMAQALKRQDWFQVTIEVLIVVIGIFLGLQVTKWNGLCGPLTERRSSIGGPTLPMMNKA